MSLILNRKLPPREPVVSATGVPYETIWDVVALCWKQLASDRISMKEVHSILQAHVDQHSPPSNISVSDLRLSGDGASTAGAAQTNIRSSPPSLVNRVDITQFWKGERGGSGGFSSVRILEMLGQEKVAVKHITRILGHTSETFDDCLRVR